MKHQLLLYPIGFQLHHTGIKTHARYTHSHLIYRDFNCTIQELKPQITNVSADELIDFNCTIQELKQIGQFPSYDFTTYFNCTIQELKLLTEIAKG